jgi:transposase-like protein
VKRKRKFSQRRLYEVELKERLKKFHEEQGVSYKLVAQTIGISIGVLYNFTSGIRELKEHNQKLLNEYLVSKGY